MPGTPLYPKDMATEWMNLKKQVKGAFTSGNSKTAFSKIAAGVLNVFTSLVVKAGATIVAEYESGVQGIYFGRLVFGPDDAEGIIITDSEGNYSFATFSRISDNYGFTVIYDKEGNHVVSTDADSEKGLARPWLEHTFVNTTELTTPPAARTVSGTTDTAVVSLLTPVQHPRMHYSLYVQISVGGSTAEIKFKEIGTGTTMHSFVASGSGFYSGDFDFIDYDFGDDYQIDITLRRASGSGNVGLTLLSLAGRQS